MESVYQIQGSHADSQYEGCGRAWAAIKDGQVVAIRYMHKCNERAAVDALPAWVKAVDPCGLDAVYRRNRPPAAVLGRCKRAAIAAGHPETGPRGGYIPATRIVNEAMAFWRAADRADFGTYRAKVRAELETMGEVTSGMLSCWEFLPGR